MSRALFSAAKKNQQARDAAAQRRSRKKPAAPPKPRVSPAERAALREQREIERRRAPEAVAMAAADWPSIPKRKRNSGPVFPEVLPGSAFVKRDGTARQWLQLEISWVQRSNAIYWVVVPNCFYPWCKTSADKAEAIAAEKWTARLNTSRNSALPVDRQPVVLDGWSLDTSEAEEDARRAISTLPPHVAGLPIYVPRSSRVRAINARAALNALPGPRQYPPPELAQHVANTRLLARRQRERAASSVPEICVQSAPPQSVAHSTDPRSWPAPTRRPMEVPEYILTMAAREILQAFEELQATGPSAGLHRNANPDLLLRNGSDGLS